MNSSVPLRSLVTRPCSIDGLDGWSGRAQALGYVASEQIGRLAPLRYLDGTRLWKMVGILVLMALFAGCAPRALSPGSPMPELQVAGWTNGAAPVPAELEGKVLVLEVFATW